MIKRLSDALVAVGGASPLSLRQIVPPTVLCCQRGTRSAWTRRLCEIHNEHSDSGRPNMITYVLTLQTIASLTGIATSTSMIIA